LGLFCQNARTTFRPAHFRNGFVLPKSRAAMSRAYSSNTRVVRDQNVLADMPL
jgi:hypothetical protein